jgi:predicted Fe-S protein YdhL (DUF1289 family)
MLVRLKGAKLPSDAGIVPSPCINVCNMNPHTRCCEGCWRTINEIAQWAGSSDAAKRDILDEIARRKMFAASHDD